MLALEHRSVEALSATCTHEVDASEILVRRHHTDSILAWDVHEARQTCTRTYEDTVEAHLVELIVAHSLAHDDIWLEIDAHLAHDVDLCIDHAVWQTELRDTILQHATNLVECLEDCNIVAQLDHIGSKCKTRRT